MHATYRLLPITLVGLILAAPFAAAATPAGGQQSTPPGPVTTAAPAAAEPDAATDAVPELVIAGHVVMRLRTRAGGLTPQERAYSLRQRLGPILTLPDLSADDIKVSQNRPGQTASLYVRGRLLMTVDRNLAEANNTSVEGLAEQWARNLQATLPRVNISVRLSPGTSWTAPVQTARTATDDSRK